MEINMEKLKGVYKNRIEKDKFKVSFWIYKIKI